MLVAPFVMAVLTARALTSHFTSPQHPRVLLPHQGVLRGKVLTSRRGRNFFAFQGIPYAAPPIGHLRFQPPQAAPAWRGERWAWREGKDCPHNHQLGWYQGNEDCLYLNVYTPKLPSGSAHPGLAVMVWIHGGGFNSGSGSSELYGPSFLLDQEIVLVTFNYRLGALGFLSMGTEELPGNYGLKDHVAALLWVRSNIQQFGGNPNSVTIFGESAGGASVHLLMLSPLARGLFHRAIAQSGSAYNPWAVQRTPGETARNLAAAVGCGGHQDSSQLIACLRGVEPRRLVQFDRDWRQRVTRRRTLFVPAIEPANTEGAFLTENPRTLMARGDIADVSLIAGVTTHEGILEFADGFIRGNFSSAHKAAMKRYLALVPGLEPGSSQWVAAWRKVAKAYIQFGRGRSLEEFLLVASDADFILGVDEFVRDMSSLGRSSVYYYQFSHDGHLGVLKKLGRVSRPGGTAHSDDLGYLFSKALLPTWIVASPADHNVISRMTKMWTDFAITGDPTPDGSLGVTWSPVEAPLLSPQLATTRYLDIGSSLSMRPENLNAKRVALFQQLIQEQGVAGTWHGR